MKRAAVLSTVFVAAAFVAMLAIFACACLRPFTAKANAAAIADAKLQSLGQKDFKPVNTFYLGDDAYKTVYRHDKQTAVVYVHHGQVTSVVGLPQ